MTFLFIIYLLYGRLIFSEFSVEFVLHTCNELRIKFDFFTKIFNFVDF